MGIWRRVWTEETPLAADVALGFLARQFKLTGGNIKNIALTAAFLAVAEGRSVAMEHLLQATRREYQKMGKTLTAAELEEVWAQESQKAASEETTGNRRSE